MKKLRSGYTTGACAAAAAKAATLHYYEKLTDNEVEIPFPDNSRVSFKILYSHFNKKKAVAAVMKDAGDDPDVTNGAVIEVTVKEQNCETSDVNNAISIRGGNGVGIVTKKGLAVPIGEPAINPVPRKMIKEAVQEAKKEAGIKNKCLTVTVSVENGEEIAQKTLNKRLGIIGGISILGTTGIVKPISASAWKDTIRASMDVARAAGLETIIISTGRTSEKAVSEILKLPEESLVMMGDYLGFSLKEARNKGFTSIHLAGMWAKIMKCALEIPQTHVRNGILDVERAIEFLKEHDNSALIPNKLYGSNSAREIYDRLIAMNRKDLINDVCLKAKSYAEKVSGLTVQLYLVNASGDIVVKV